MVRQQMMLDGCVTPRYGGGTQQIEAAANHSSRTSATAPTYERKAMPSTRDGIAHDAITNVLIGVLDEFNVEYHDAIHHKTAGVKRSQLRDENIAAARDVTSRVKSQPVGGLAFPVIVITA